MFSVFASVGNFVAVAGYAVPITASANSAANASGVWALVENVLVVGIGASCLVWLIAQVPMSRLTGPWPA